MLVAARGVALTLGGGLPIAGLPREFLVLGAGYIGPFPIPTVLAVVAYLLAGNWDLAHSNPWPEVAASFVAATWTT
jgi:ribose/xylose/arabinose/galactoside ABC-type transport system permease subunit